MKRIKKKETFRTQQQHNEKKKEEKVQSAKSKSCVGSNTSKNIKYAVFPIFNIILVKFRFTIVEHS